MQILKYFSIYILFLLTAATSVAQQLSGKVLADDSETPISEVVIQIKGTKNSAVSNEQGEFSIMLNADKSITLLVSHVAYVNKEVVLKPPFEQDILIRMEREQLVLNQVDVKGNTDDALPQGNLQPLTPLSVNEVATPFNEFSQLINT